MPQSLMRPFGVPNPAVLSDGDRISLAGEIRQSLLSLASRSKDKRVQALRKGIDRGDNRIAETAAAILADAHNSRREDPQGLALTISGFFSSRTRRLQRKLSEIMQLETVHEGELNNIEMRVAQGDLSRPALLELKKEVRENRAILDEMEAAIDAELFRSGPS